MLEEKREVEKRKGMIIMTVVTLTNKDWETQFITKVKRVEIDETKMKFIRNSSNTIVRNLKDYTHIYVNGKAQKIETYEGYKFLRDLIGLGFEENYDENKIKETDFWDIEKYHKKGRIVVNPAWKAETILIPKNYALDKF